MPDQWDPKYPAQNEKWETLYAEAEREIQDEKSAWRTAFLSILAAERAGQFAYVKQFYDRTAEVHTVLVARWGLWELHCRPIFDRPQKDWPQYAKDVRAAVPGRWLDSAGDNDGLPPPWDKPTGPHQNDEGRRTVWAFKATVLLIAGRIERRIRPLQRDRDLLAQRFQEDRGADGLRASG